jgi:hypothetical protein
MGIAAAVIALLSPYLAEAGKSIAGKAGDVALEGVKALHEAIRRKFTDDGDDFARQTLERVEAQPESETRKQSLAEVLDEKVKADPDFAGELRRLLENVPGVHVHLRADVEEFDVTDAEIQIIKLMEGVDASIDAELEAKDIRGEKFKAQNVTVTRKTESDDVP